MSFLKTVGDYAAEVYDTGTELLGSAADSVVNYYGYEQAVEQAKAGGSTGAAQTAVQPGYQNVLSPVNGSTAPGGSSGFGATFAAFPGGGMGLALAGVGTLGLIFLLRK